MSSYPKRRKLVAWAGILALLALSVLYVVPHSWHKEDGKRHCTVCQAYRTPAAPTTTAPVIEPPQVEQADAPQAEQPGQTSLVACSFDPRAPPVPHAL